MSKQDRYLVVKGKGGVGNRLLVLADVFRLIRRQMEPLKLVIEWNDRYYASHPGANVFHDVFEISGELAPEFRRTVDIPDFDNTPIHPACWSGYLHDDVYRHIDGRSRWIHPGSWEGLSATVGSRLSDMPGIYVSCRAGNVIPSDNPKWNIVREILRAHLAPTVPVRRLVDEFAGEFLEQQPVVGVHVRYCAPQKRCELADVFPAVDTFPANWRILLATDSRTVLGEFQRRYRNRLINREKWYSSLPDANGKEANALHNRRDEVSPTDSPEQILRDAVVEMFLLARCPGLIHQRNSTFSHIAAFYSDARHVISWG